MPSAQPDRIKTADRNAANRQKHTEHKSQGAREAVTIELVPESPSTSQLGTFNFCAREEHLHEQTQEIIAQNPQGNPSIIESFDSILRPADLLFQLIN